jgi:hypothetical protein
MIILCVDQVARGRALTRRILGCVAIFFGGLAVVSGLSAVGSRSIWPEGRVEFRPEVIRIDTPLEPGVQSDFSVGVYNGTRRSVRLIGSAKSCGPEGCATVTGLSLEIPPGSERRLSGHYTPATFGSLSYEDPIYTDCPDRPSIPLKIIGTAAKKTEE